MSTKSPISEEEKSLVQASFEKIPSISVEAADIFYTKLFELDPAIKPLFTSDIVKQGAKLMTMIGAAVKGLDDLEALIPVVQNLGKRQVGYGVTFDHYDTVKEALVYTLEKGVGDDWNDATAAAWSVVFDVLAKVMKDASLEVA